MEKKIIFICLFIFLIYFFSNPQPRDWYKHYVYLADAFLHQRLDLKDYPSFYHEIIDFKGKKYIPFPPAPAFLLIPFVAFWGTEFKQVYLAMILGAINGGLLYFLLNDFLPWQRTVLIIFYNLGTVVWYASIIGTTWFYALLCSNFFLFLALIFFLKKKKIFLSGLFLGLAVLSRHPSFLSLPFFLSFLQFKKKKMSMFFLGLIPPLLFQLGYNYLRFGHFGQEGYLLLYKNYIHSSYPYTIFKMWFKNFPYYGWLDLRNIPLHLFTLFFLLPEKIDSFPFFKPSPYGMSIILTSPLFFYLLKADYKKKIVKRSLLTSILIFLLVGSHYMQGWVQFGYRYLIDFLPFLMIILVSGLPKKINFFLIFLLCFSILANYFGVWWGVKLGW